jgi:phosphonatase-like hydrolase
VSVSLVVFDIPGTTVDDDDAVNLCLRWAFSKFGVVVSRDAVDAVSGEPKTVAIAKLLTQVRTVDTSTNDPDVVEIHKRFQTLILSRYRDAVDVRPVEGSMDVFRELSEVGIRVALDAGFSRVTMDALLARLEWIGSGVIGATVASDEVARGRSYPDSIERAMSLTGVDDASTVAKVSDTPAGLLSGNAAGCGRVIGITTRPYSRAQLDPIPHTHLVERLSEIPRLLT